MLYWNQNTTLVSIIITEFCLIFNQHNKLVQRVVSLIKNLEKNIIHKTGL